VDEVFLSPEETDRIAEEVGGIASGSLKLVVGPVSPAEMVMEFIFSSFKDNKLENKALPGFAQMAHSEFGLGVGRTATAAYDRRAGGQLRGLKARSQEINLFHAISSWMA
jgi:hypothetical protein